ncbi:MAG: glucoamylase family protein [Elusimicrobiota bacterium]
MKKLNFLLLTLLLSYSLALCLFAATISTSTLAGVYVKNPPTMMIDDFDDGVPPNNLGGASGSFNARGGVANESIVSAGALGGTGCSLRIDYDVSSQVEQGAYSGYWTRFHSGENITRDLTDYKCLSFYVKGGVGGEFFKVGFSTGAGGWNSRVYINDYLDGGVTQNWQKVMIPFDNFCNTTYWAQIYEFTVTFESSAVAMNGSPPTGTIYVDNLLVTSSSMNYVRLDYYNDKLSINGTGGETSSCGGEGGIITHSIVSTTYYSAPNCMQINYNVPNIPSWVSLYSIVGGTTTGWGQSLYEFSAYDRISYYAKVVNVAGKVNMTIKVSTGTGSVGYWQEMGLIKDTWAKYTACFYCDFAPNFFEQNCRVGQWEFVITYSNHPSEDQGTVYIDNVQFEKDIDDGHIPFDDTPFDTTPPTAPYNLKIMDTADGRLVESGVSSFTWVNWLTCIADSGAQDSTLESVRFECSPNGSVWTTVGTDYDLSDNTYSAYWDTTALPEGSGYYLRAVARDISGNQAYSTTFIGLQVKHYPDISTLTDEQLLDLIQKQIFWYYWVETNPDRGIVQDRARNFQQDTYDYASVATTGLGLVATCIAHQRGWISFTDAYNRVNGTLKTYYDAPTSTSSTVLVQYKGFYYHHTNLGGARSGESEFSTIDTALFVASALYTGKYFLNHGGYENPWNYAEQIYRRVDWNWVRGGDAYLDWGFTPTMTEVIFDQGEMSGYSECILAYLLGFGSPETGKKLTDASDWNTLARLPITYKDISYIFEKSLFTHQYPQLFLNLQSKKDNSTAGSQCYATNTFAATVHNHRYCYDNRSTYSTYGENSWGLGATDGPPNGEYHAYGIGDHDGTVALSNLFTAITERPTEVKKSIRELYTVHTSTLWGKYAFCDSYNTQGSVWRNPDVVGLQQGAVIIAIENYRSNNSIKDTFTGIPYIQNAFTALGFIPDTYPPGQIVGLTTSVLGSSVRLNWTASGDDDYTGNISSGVYEVKSSTLAADTWDTAPANYLNYNTIWSTNVVVGAAQSRTIPGLAGNTSHYFWIKIADDSFNWSPLSNKCTSYISDIIPPFTITNLSALKGTFEREIKLSWTTPADDNLLETLPIGSEYKIQHSTWPNWSQIKWSTASAQISISTSGINQGVTVSRVVTGLIAGTTYFCRLWTRDEVSNWSGLSNGATAQAKILDIISPSAITNLSALAGASSGEVSLKWTTPGDDGIVETLPIGSGYKIQHSTWPNWSQIKWSTASAQINISTSGINQGVTVGRVVTGLVAGTTYFFRLWTRDEVSNWSGLSNGATVPARSWVLWDDCDSHPWYGAAWGYQAPDSLTWGSYYGRQCLKVAWTTGSPWRGFIRTDWVFSNENWESPVTGFKADIYVEEAYNNYLDVKLEPKRANFATIESVSNASATDLSVGTWHTCSWTFTIAQDYSAVTGFVFDFDGLGNTPPANVYVDNIRLITTSGDIEWDDMDDSSHNWAYSGDFVNWNIFADRKEPISHNYACSVSSAASVFLQWNDSVSGASSATVTSGDLSNVNWSGYKSIKIFTRCSSTNNDIKIGFRDGTNYIATAAKRVSTTEWTEISWDLPTWNFWNSVNYIEFSVTTNSDALTGTLYIDDIRFSDKLLP